MAVAVAVCAVGCASTHAENAPGECGGDEWKCVYSPKRLVVQEPPCLTVRGIVTDARYALDGDAIVYVRLDPEYAQFANQTNYEGLGRDMMELEIVCRHPVFRFLTFRCWTCRSKTVVPRAGDHIEADGVYVQDTRHRHMELHPVTRITRLPGALQDESLGSARSARCAPERPRSYSSASSSFVSSTCSLENFSMRR